MSSSLKGEFGHFPSIYFIIPDYFYYSRFSVSGIPLVRMSAFVHLFLRNLVTVNATPSVEYISYHKRDENGNISHCLQSTLTGTAIG